MRRQKRRAGHVSHERWLVSYADFITLLFAFFVVLYASSQVDKRKVGRLAMAIQVAFQEMGVFQGVPAQPSRGTVDPVQSSGMQVVENAQRAAILARIALQAEQPESPENGDLAQLQNELETTLAAEIRSQEIAMRREPDGLVISLREAGFFESGSVQMKAGSQMVFDRIAGLLHKRDCRVRIEGHTDNVPIHNAQFSSNWELSTARATEVVRLLIMRDGYDPSRLSAAGYAEYHPVATNGTIEGRGMNRRVDIVVLGQGAPVPPVGKAESGSGKPSPLGEPVPHS